MSDVQILDARAYRIRHIAPGTGEGSTITLLGKTYGFTELPLSHIPTSHDLVEGSYSRRLGDSGEFSLTFPNAAGSKGLWRERFSEDYRNEFIEIYRDDVLEFVGYIDRVEIDDGSVTISGKDAWSLLRFAYESDRLWTAAPRELIAHYTQVPVCRAAEDFDGTALPAGWSAITYFGVTPTVAVAESRVKISSANVGSNDEPWIEYDLGSALGNNWRLSVVGYAFGDSATAFRVAIGQLAGSLQVPAVCEIRVTNQPRPWNPYGGSVTGFSLDKGGNAPTPLVVDIVRTGRWIAYYAAGQLLGIEAASSSWTNLRYLKLGAAQLNTSSYYAQYESVTLTELQPFLARGTNVGQYVLPTAQPTGGLRGRYWNDADIQGLTDSARLGRCFAPDREPYGERLDATIDTSGGLSIPMTPGASDTYFSVRWFGAVYLRLDQGNYGFEISNFDDGARLWVGKTTWGDQILDDWNGGGPRTISTTLTASTLGSQAGWYPIVLEYCQVTSGKTITLKFTPPAGGYTDPGGTVIAASTKIVIPSTSLSPLGCYDNRIQNQPFFDITTDVMQQFGYQMECSPQQFESGEFPGRVVPQIRVGSDTDVVMTTDRDDSGEPIMQSGVTRDSSEQIVVVRGLGSGQASPGSQVTSTVFDVAGMNTALFVAEAQISAADIDFTDLLEARLNAELALRATPWEELRGAPRGQDRLADTWPLSETLSAMRWRPGDGVRVDLSDTIGLVDTDPRQITQVSRTFGSEGRTGTTIAFRQRPRSAAASVRSLVQAALKPSRNYQGQKVLLSGNYVGQTIGAGPTTGSAYCYIPLNGSDQILKAELRITVNTALQPLGIQINGVDRTSALGGPWSTYSTTVDITQFAKPATTTGDNRLYFLMYNFGASGTSAEYNVFVEVLR